MPIVAVGLPYSNLIPIAIANPAVKVSIAIIKYVVHWTPVVGSTGQGVLPRSHGPSRNVGRPSVELVVAVHLLFDLRFDLRDLRADDYGHFDCLEGLLDFVPAHDVVLLLL